MYDRGSIDPYVCAHDDADQDQNDADMDDLRAYAAECQFGQPNDPVYDRKRGKEKYRRRHIDRGVMKWR